MRKIDRKQEPFNTSPLGEAAHDRQYRQLSYPEKRIAERYGCDPCTARLMAYHAGFKGDE